MSLCVLVDDVGQNTHLLEHSFQRPPFYQIYFGNVIVFCIVIQLLLLLLLLIYICFLAFVSSLLLGDLFISLVHVWVDQPGRTSS